MFKNVRVVFDMLQIKISFIIEKLVQKFYSQYKWKFEIILINMIVEEFIIFINKSIILK